jgi:hypothetical protein
MNVLKKTATVAAIAAAALLSASPLALADNKKDDHHDGGHKTIVKQEGDGGNNACKNEQKGDFEADGGKLLGIIPLLNGFNAFDQNNALQCVNVLNNNLNKNKVFVAVLGD